MGYTGLPEGIQSRSRLRMATTGYAEGARNPPPTHERGSTSRLRHISNMSKARRTGTSEPTETEPGFAT
ncbi:hypothetical protein R1flu_021531 [Riccia fluitans]|uniref:Uncharacterized protein n=1 Tax=Riccia fluitans TaxID=41844 RepID=A0ABD1ZPU8_9MARC